MSYSKFKVRAASIAAGLVIAAMPGVAMAHNHDNDNGNDNEHNKVTICHATGSTTNPYVEITIDANGVVHGHAKHVNDIIPSFTYKSHGDILTFDAQGDQSILANGCVVGGQGGGGTDVCLNIEGVQTQVPAGMVVDSQGNCTTPSNNTTTTTTQVLGATTGGQGAAQVAVVPQGSVNGGGGAASSTVSKASAVGLVGSLLSAGAGLALLNRRQG